MRTTPSSRRRIAALAVAAATTLATLVLAPAAPAQTVGQLRFGPNYRLGDDPSVARGRDVPGLAVNPNDPRQVVEVDVEYITGNCSYHTSFDGGASWPVGGNFSAPPGWPSPPCSQNFDSGGYAHGNASVVWGSGQNVYTAFSSHRGPFQRPESGIIAGIGDDSLVARSTDGGRTFETAVPVILGTDPQPFFIRPQVAVHPGGAPGGGDRVYVNAWACEVTSGGCSAGGGRREMWAARSDDGGVTWTAPVLVSRPGERIREPAQPVVDPRNGHVYMAWRNRDPIPSPNPTGVTNRVVLARSTDLGATWEWFDVGPLANTPAGTATGSGGHPRLAIDPRNGNLYVAWQDGQLAGAAGDQDIVFARSTDGGATWSAPKRVNDDRVGNGVAQQVPRVSVVPDGRVDISWMDRRHDQANAVVSCCPGFSASGRGMGDIFYAYSLDAGANFSANRRVTDRTLNRDVGLTGVGGYTWYGPVQESLGNDEVLFAWTDSREGDYDNGVQDIYLAKLSLRAPAALPVQRLPDANVPGLAVTLSRQVWPGGGEAAGNPGPIPVTKVVVVNEGDPTALPAAVLARGNFGPLLASRSAALPAEVRAEVARLQAVGAFVIGSEEALGSGVVSGLADARVPRDRITRLAGSSPADTARLIALAMDTRTDAQKAAGTKAFDAAVIVNPATPEAGAAAGLAASLRLPILFADRDGLPGPTSAALGELNITTTLVVGGPGAVSDAVVSSLPGARRLGGGDPYAVSRAVVAESVARSLPINVVYVGDAAQPLDAALAGAAAARSGGLLVLSPGAEPGGADQALSELGLRSSVDRLIVTHSLPVLGGPGYWLVARDGGIFAFGRAGFFGSTGAMRLNQPVVGMARTPTNLGYFLVASDGGVFAFGDARFRGSTGNVRLNRPMVGMGVTPRGNGYWLVASDGGVFSFGDARFFGSTGSIRLNQPIVGMAPTPSGNGYWLVASDGGVFSFGDARFFGSAGSIRLNQPVVGMAATPSGNGYWLVARDGGIFAFGDARFFGSTGSIRLNQPVVGMDATPSAGGYHLVASDGGVFAFGDAIFSGSTGAMRLNQPVVGMAAAS